MNTYIVNCKTTPGMHSQYEFNVEVNAENSEDAIEKAYRRTKSEGFHDYARFMWKFKITEMWSS